MERELQKLQEEEEETTGTALNLYFNAIRRTAFLEIDTKWNKVMCTSIDKT